MSDRPQIDNMSSRHPLKPEPAKTKALSHRPQSPSPDRLAIQHDDSVVTHYEDPESTTSAPNIPSHDANVIERYGSSSINKQLGSIKKTNEVNQSAAD